MTPNTHEYGTALRATLVILLLNLSLCIAKLLTGWLGHSFALIADGINNLTDVGVSATLLLGFRLARKPADAQHPYGHGRIEQELSRLVSIFVLVTGGGIIWEAVKRLESPGQLPAGAVLVVAFLSIGVKFGMFVGLQRVARRIRSGALAADALNHKSDMAATTCVLVGAGAMWLGGPAWGAADAYATIAVGLLMVTAAGREIYSVSSELLDQIPPPEVVENIRRLAAGYPGIHGVDRITGRKSGIYYLIDLHLEVDPQMPVRRAHYLGHQVKDWIMAAMPGVVDIVIHIEPEGRATTTE